MYYSSLPQTVSFESHMRTKSDKDYFSMLGILKALEHLNPQNVKPDSLAILETLFQKFHSIATQLKRRYANRDTLEIEDEYDVQDLLHALLRLHFNDIRPEDSVPKYAGSSKRIDFVLPDIKTVIEVKKTRKGLADKVLGDELSIDISHYRKHPDCETLICFIYDPDAKIHNQAGFVKDLNALSHEGVIDVKVYINPS